MRQKYPFFYLSTQTRDIRISVEPDRSPLDYFALEDIVARLYENGEDFVVLGYIPSAKYAQNHHYIQTTLEDDGNPQSRYLLETRIWEQNGDFKHYRTFAEFRPLMAEFKRFAELKTPNDLTQWEDVTAEFADSLFRLPETAGFCAAAVAYRPSLSFPRIKRVARATQKTRSGSLKTLLRRGSDIASIGRINKKGVQSAPTI